MQTSQVSTRMTSQHLVALLICINQLTQAGPGRRKAGEEKWEDTIEGTSSGVLAHVVATLLQLAALAFRSMAIFLLLLLGNIALDSVALAHKVFAIVQPPHLDWIHQLVPDILDPALVHSVKASL